MQQGKQQKTQSTHTVNRKRSRRPLQTVESYLELRAMKFSKGSMPLKKVKESMTIMKKMEHALGEAENTSKQIEALKRQMSQNMSMMNAFLADQKEEGIVELRKTVYNLECSLQEQGILVDGDQELSTATQFLHSMGFDQIVNMINAASVYEPEWMSRTGALLVLDHNPNTSQALVRRLTREGHTVFTAETEAQAFSWLNSKPIETILVDYLMFKDDIYAFLKKIEEDPNLGYIPIIVIGAPERNEIMEKITESGVGDYLAKPVNPALLKMRVHAVLEKKYAFEQRLKRSKEMQRTRKELESAIQDLPDGFAIFDQENRMVMHNDRLFGFYPHLKHRIEMVRGGLTFEKFIEANVSAGSYLFEEEKGSSDWILEKKANFMLPASQWEESLANGTVLGITTYRTPDGGGALVAKDISKDKAKHKDLTFLAYHDSLTGLPNRKAFHQKLTQSIHNANNLSGQILAVLFLDLDGFKAINDTYGHEMGDWLLNQVGQRLRSCVRGDDVVARFGGDEFCIILNHATSRAKIKSIARRILKSVTNPFIREGVSMSIGVSIGIGVYSKGIKDSEALLKEADSAMYRVKQSGKGRFEFYDEMSHPKSSGKPKPTKSDKDWNENASRPKEIA